MKIQVTQNDIDKGKRCDNTLCPVALALNRKGVFARVSMCFIRARGRIAEIPEHVSELIFQFDHGLDVAPFEFEVEFK